MWPMSEVTYNCRHPGEKGVHTCNFFNRDFSYTFKNGYKAKNSYMVYAAKVVPCSWWYLTSWSYICLECSLFMALLLAMLWMLIFFRCYNTPLILYFFAASLHWYATSDFKRLAPLFASPYERVRRLIILLYSCEYLNIIKNYTN